MSNVQKDSKSKFFKDRMLANTDEITGSGLTALIIKGWDALLPYLPSLPTVLTWLIGLGSWLTNRLHLLLFAFPLIFFLFSLGIAMLRRKEKSHSEQQLIEGNAEDEITELGVLHCYVMCEDSSKPMRGAICIVENERIKKPFRKSTGENGVAQLKVPYGFYSITIEAKGYDTHTEAVYVSKKERGSVSACLQLSRSSQEQFTELKKENANLREQISDFTKFNPLISLATSEKRNVSRVVLLTECMIEDGNYNWGSDNPYVIFTFRIFHGAIFSISISDNVDGFIWYRDTRLTGKVEVISKAANYGRGIFYKDTTFKLRQWLTPNESKKIANEQYPDKSFFRFDELKIYVQAPEGIEDVVPQPIQWVLFDRISRSGKTRLGQLIT